MYMPPKGASICYVRTRSDGGVGLYPNSRQKEAKLRDSVRDKVRKGSKKPKKHQFQTSYLEAPLMENFVPFIMTFERRYFSRNLSLDFLPHRRGRRVLRRHHCHREQMFVLPKQRAASSSFSDDFLSY